MTFSSNRSLIRLFLSALCVSTFFGCAQAQPGPGTPSPVGTAAPEIKATDYNGEEVDFAAVYADGPLLVYFYPKADTPGCTAQACSLRDSYEQLTDRGVTVIGISGDTMEAQRAFREKHQLPFTLVTDTDGKVMEAFGVPRRFGLASRQAFLIREGAIVWHDGSASTDRQAADVLEVLERWSPES